MTRLVTLAPLAALSAISRHSRPLESFSVISFTVLCFFPLALWLQATSGAAEVPTAPSLPVVICNVGTGINRNHPDLSNKIWKNEAEINGDPDVDDDGNGYVDDFYGLDAKENTGDPMDDVGHGTHVAGTIAGLNNESTAFTNWFPKIMSCRFMANEGGSRTSAVACMKYCRLNNATAVIFPFDARKYGKKFVLELNKLDTKGTLIISAAGDLGSNVDATNPTAALVKMPKNLIVVASVDQDNNLSEFSNYGNKSVTLGGPGENQNSTAGIGYVSASSTAMAAAHVTRAVALLYGIRSRNVTMVLDILRRTLTMSDDLRNKTLWGGVVDEDKAAAFSSPFSSPSTLSPFSSPSTLPLSEAPAGSSTEDAREFYLGGWIPFSAGDVYVPYGPLLAIPYTESNDPESNFDAMSDYPYFPHRL